MRAYAIVVFILAFHAALAMINVSTLTNLGLNATIDTSTKGTFNLIPSTNYTMPSSKYFCETATGENIYLLDSEDNVNISPNDFIGNFIQSVEGLAAPFNKFLAVIKDILFSVHDTAAPIFGEFNAWCIQGMLYFIFVVSLVQIVTGRSFKTME